MALAEGSPARGLMATWFPHAKTPFVANAPMYGHTDGRMAAAVTRAGGYGFLACGFDFSANSPQTPIFEAELIKARSLLSITDLTAPLPIGCGFLTFKPAGFIEHVIPVLLKHRVTGIWLSFPKSGADHKPIIAAIRSAREESHWDVRIWVQIGDLASAKEAVEQGADIIVAQGIDAGGHQWAQGAGVIILLPEVKNWINQMGKGGEVAVIAAGGIMDGKGVVAGLSLGADGIVMGTRFLCTTECPAPATIKELLVSTSDGARCTVKSNIPDLIQNYGFWAPRYNGRSIIGPAYREHLEGVSIDELILKQKQATAEGDKEGRSIVWAGAGVGGVKGVLSAEQVLTEVRDEAKETIKKLGNVLFHI